MGSPCDRQGNKPTGPVPNHTCSNCGCSLKVWLTSRLLSKNHRLLGVGQDQGSHPVRKMIEAHRRGKIGAGTHTSTLASLPHSSSRSGPRIIPLSLHARACLEGADFSGQERRVLMAPALPLRDRIRTEPLWPPVPFGEPVTQGQAPQSAFYSLQFFSCQDYPSSGFTLWPGLHPRTLLSELPP